MKRCCFRLQVVTPLFLAGADQRLAELRPPSVRGVLRFWFRALAGPLLGYERRVLQRAEATLFGSTEQASPWLLRTCTFDREPVSEGTFPRSIAYLGYGPIIGNKSQRGFFPPGSSCQLKIRWLKEDALLIQLLEATIWLWGHLGGLGARVRRGFGSVYLEPEEGDILPIWFGRAESPEKLAGFLENGLRECREVFATALEGIPRPQDTPTSPDSLVLDNRFAELYIGTKVFDDWSGALEAVGEALITFRRLHRSPDREIVRQFITSSGTPPEGTLERAGFGLPLNFYFRDLGARAQTTAVRGETEYERRAFPLLVKVMSLRKGFCVLLLRSRADFLPEGARLLLRAGEKRRELGLPREDLVGKFLKDLFEEEGSRIHGRLGEGLRIALPWPFEEAR